MRRRNHKSTKVPGVKLRPADPSSSRRVRAISEDTWADETQWCNDVGDSDDHPLRINAGGTKGKGIGSRTGSGASVNVNGGSNGFRDTCPRPLKGVVICATGVGDKVRCQPTALTSRGLTKHRPAFPLQTGCRARSSMHSRIYGSCHTSCCSWIRRS